MSAYAQLIKFGRVLENHSFASDFAKQYPEEVVAFVEATDRQVRFTPVADFFSLFPPIKRYADDGMWDYHSTLRMIEERLGTHFGKDEFKHLLMSDCYENRFVHLVGYAFMLAISELYKRQTGMSAFEAFLMEQVKS
ncbi:hypothetical protein GCM10025857_68190 [Alicyclobacillus contaminans]|uniref:hypothetical protein n=1 Tax=Alicyclobacillus contaminans TaxID=392016 RepID=UPI0003FA2229|nr:hypothetical protein [Alicyclobacillus contaminans]GMA52013.1 hypothetical protein GCM10025857_33700 [Alicyclobacillus contaminans]GMA55439.1 hypothetical protein GCM10025857_67960 [Alicyclobacillus contaminans]GMA55462.1 hypothetical protein GCM10025857_68190 [Alicyclobacillus contaminans]